MIELPHYVRIKSTYSRPYSINYTVEEDEFILLESVKDETWFEGRTLSGDSVFVNIDNFTNFELPELRQNERYIVASIAEYASTHTEDISFAKNTVIIVTKDVDSNWSEGTVVGYNGKRLGRAGLFPKSFVVRMKSVKELSGMDKENGGVLFGQKPESVWSIAVNGKSKQQWMSTSVENIKNSTQIEASPTSTYDTPPETALLTQVKTDQVIFRKLGINLDAGKPHAESIFPFQGENEGELSFEAGSIIYLRRYLDYGWIEGEFDGKVGLFPATYVRIIVDLPGAFSIGGKALRRASRHSALGVASVLYDFNGREHDELTVYAGESLSLLELVNAEWARCYDPGRDRTGIIPISFLNIFMNDDDEELSHEESSDSEGFSGSHLFEKSNSNRGNEEVFDAEKKLDFFTAQTAPIDSWKSENKEIPVAVKNAEPNPNLDKKLSSPTPICTNDFFSQEKKPPARPPPPKLKTIANVAVAIKKNPPPRPTELPKRFSLASASTAVNGAQPSLPSAHHYSSVPSTPAFEKQVSFGEEKSADDTVSKQHVVSDLISSELQYLSDIGMWEAEISQSSGIAPEYKKTLVNGFPQLRELSRQLVSQLVEQQSKHLDYQCFGQAFLSLRDNFMKTFGLYFRSVEAVSNVIEGRDQILQEALNDCVVEMRSLGSNVFDVPTAVSRPIQRCLKYPLFIGELIKKTPLNHIDHPKLLEALKQMSLLASKMNESKRRKELVVKYRNAGLEPLTKRLSRLNMHSVKKKSSRFRYRLTSQIGLVQMDKDTAFDSMAENLDRCERRICKLLHAVQVYKQLIVTQSKKYVDTYTTTEKLCGNSNSLNAEIRSYCKALLQESSWLAQYLDDAIGAEAKKFLRLPITKVIQKRYDKLIDFVAAKKQDKNPEEIRLRQCNYEALNNQLKATLPKIIENIKKRTFFFVEAVVTKDMEFFNTFARLREQMSQEARNFFTLPFSTYVGSSERRLHSFLSIGKAISAEVSTSKKCVIAGNDGVVTRMSSAVDDRIVSICPAISPIGVVQAKKKVSSPPPPRPDFPKNISPVQQLKEAEQNLIDFDENLLDLCTPLEPRNAAALDDNISMPIASVDALLASDSLVDSKQSDLPSDLLFSEITLPSAGNQLSVTGTPLPMSADALLNDLVPSEIEKNQILSSLAAPLIPYRPNELTGDVTRKRTSNVPLYSLPEVPSIPQRSLTKPALPTTGAVSVLAVKHSYDKPFDGNYPVYYEPPVFGSKASYESQGSVLIQKGVAPVRSAPPPPGDNNRLVENSSSLIFERWKAGFDYNRYEDCQVSLAADEKVIVIKKCDDANNDEWWLIRTESGDVGYVPAAYLTPL